MGWAKAESSNSSRTKRAGTKKNNNPSMGCEHKQHTQEVL